MSSHTPPDLTRLSYFCPRFVALEIAEIRVVAVAGGAYAPGRRPLAPESQYRAGAGAESAARARGGGAPARPRGCAPLAPPRLRVRTELPISLVSMSAVGRVDVVWVVEVVMLVLWEILIFEWR